MRNFILIIALFAFFNSFSRSLVAFREGSLTGVSPYFLNGSAFIEEYDDGTFEFRLDNNYSTNVGPDVQLFLTNNNNFITPINISGALFLVDVGNDPGGISHFSGAYNQMVPSGLTSLSDFDHVVFVCSRFGMLSWGNGSFGSITSVCNPTASSITEVMCDSYTSPSGKVFTATGVFTDTIQNIAMCDSIITIDLTIDNIDITTTNTGNVIEASESNATYQWLDCNNGNALISGATNQSYTTSISGNYSVVITKGACTDTSACENIISVGIDEADRLGSSFKLYPNPTNDNATLELDNSSSDSRVTVLDATGKVVYSINSKRSKLNLDMNNLIEGLYFVSIQNAVRHEVIKLIKQ